MQLLIIDPFEENFLAEVMAISSLEVTYAPEATRDEILIMLKQVDILVLKSKTKVDHQLITAAPNLKLIIRAGSGTEHIDVTEAERRGIRVAATPGANADAVGEMAVGMLLNLMRNIGRADAEVRQFKWQREANRGEEINGKVVGIIGYGHTGRAAARKLSGFGARVMAYDKYISQFTDPYARESQLEDVFEQADILSLHVPLTAETQRMVDEQFLLHFKKPIYLLNLSRGLIVDTAVVYRWLMTGQLKGAALDVLENEDMEGLSPLERQTYTSLFRQGRVVLSPHIGGWTVESARRINAQVVAEVRSLLGRK